jgi:hypothetical protein
VATRKLRGTRVSGASAELTRLLQSYDLVMDTIAGYPSEEKGAPTGAVTIAASEQLLGRCSRGLHPHVAIDHFENPTMVAILARTTAPPTDFPGLDIMGFWAFLVALFPGHDPKLAHVSVTGCGKRAPGAGVANGELNALVRIYRAGQWEASITLPATGEFKDEKKGAFHRGGSVGVQRGPTTRTTTATGMVSRALPNNDKHGWNPAEYRAELGKKLKVSLKLNGNAVPAAQKITKLIGVIANLRDIVMRIFILMQSCPEFGWKFAGSVSVLEGTLTAKWEPELLMTPQLGGRYLPVGVKLGLEANLKIVEASATISFGVRAESKTLASELEACVEGTVGLSVEVGINLDFAEHPEPMGYNITTRGPLSARAVGKASVLGYTLLDASAEIASAVALKQGHVYVSGKGIRFQGSLVTEAVKLTLKVQVASIGPTDVDFELLPKKELMKWDNAV